MQRAQATFFRVSIGDIPGISGGPLHLDFDPIGRTQFEVSLDDRPGKVVHFSECVSAAIVEVSLPMPRRMSSGTGSAENEELRIRRPLHFLNVTSMLAIRRLKILGRQHRAFMLRISTRDSLNGGLGCVPTDNTQARSC